MSEVPPAASSQIKRPHLLTAFCPLPTADNAPALSTTRALTQALIARIEERPSRSKEAWFALFSCRCDAADDFLFRATHSPRLLGQLNNARLQWSREVQ
ncbi:hypothetical protein NG895_03230 [Aeoliella sp. ICT_H6.2]|uniref:Uncharacterized protein n=1 Tax=Aeoliella straminimaris TaxID=2954799 RepID=A0A9X2JF48_9BACT|nr:hypothetical protein [Aeoliella straminimaris]MCO6042912.1 hypothetical protein [Aeoliella straminimaris]